MTPPPREIVPGGPAPDPAPAPAPAFVALLGDARRGKLVDNIAAFGRALRRAGVRVDAARIALGVQAARIVGIERRQDLGAALEAVMLSREQDRAVFRELFAAFFRDPELARRLLAQMLPRTPEPARPPGQRPRVREALAAPRPPGVPAPARDDLALDAAMSASARSHLRHADFNALGAAEYREVERLARDIALPVPRRPVRRLHPVGRGAHARMHWPGLLREAARTGGELMRLPRLAPQQRPLPLLVLVDVSGSMERYARLLLAFLHAALRGGGGRHEVFAFGTHLTELTPAFRAADTDQMLRMAGAAIDDFAAGTRLGESLAQLRQRHARRLVGRRTLVLLVSDGLDTGEPHQLRQELDWLGRHVRSLLWLNPLLRFEGYAPLAQGAAALHEAADAMLAVHSLSALDRLAASLAELLQK